ncbi:MurR/RpiR family transcriptional regulator [Pseudoxanthomonas taiwanensis]|jgi:Transcriptional regulators|uniref:Transcriptional regulator n=1 Tax=Pseudoxanthomonas taiwanensis TaxID=176598 RepID=A0A921TEY7_9GAMM|nr:MurR/RpiR family transcriptional regulator [Pseudoxanthomonas taiwanensis]KAF1688316.1 transcriptional regulator [Pseudoxanthomonas taiwanensis]MBO2467011.1 transcriptional regulator [Xanthomonadaceae bacterium]
MSPLVKIRSERDQMSAIERRIADFILENAHLLRDYSSQQLASALGVSQSSVVKFSQKFGFRGYPDLKYSIGQALARNGGDVPAAPEQEAGDDYARLEEALRRSKAAAEEETRLLNPRERMEEIVRLVDGAARVFVFGLGDDGLFAREFAMRLSLLGVLTVHHADPILMMANLSAARAGDVMLLFSEFGQLPQLSQISRQFQACEGKVVSITRHTSNPLRAHADASLVVSAHDPQPHIEALLYRSALQYLLDFLFVLLCQANPERHRQLGINLERIRHLLET